MTFDESLAWLYSTQQFGIKLGLDNVSRLLEWMGSPEQRLKIFHVAGTNGKGSVCAMLDSILRASGYRSGLYTSPHLVEFGERIRVNGEMIPQEEIASDLTFLREISKEWEHSPTFFEFATVLALAHFAKANCDYVVLETGMGGRLDATNIITPVISVITPIAIDHAEWLGDTIEKIAFEKAGIIKTGVPVVSAPQVPLAEEVLCEKASLCSSAMTFVAEPWSGEVSLAGVHQKWNAALAIAALRASGIACAEKHIRQGLQEVVWPARFQRINERMVIDGGHNPHAMHMLVQTWREVFGSQKATVLFGALKDKDYVSMLAELAPIAAEYYFSPISNARAAAPSVFSSLTSIPSRSFSDFPTAFDVALSSTRPVLIAGSLFLAGEALLLLKQQGLVCLTGKAYEQWMLKSVKS